jgi:hypothetical protein
VTKNITEAVTLYWQNHPEEVKNIPLVITTRGKNRPQTILDDYVRPKCPKCSAELFLKPISK